MSPAPVASSPTSSSVQLQWTAAASQSPILGYRVKASDDGGATWAVLVNSTLSNAVSATVTGLRGGTAYAFIVSQRATQAASVLY